MPILESPRKFRNEKHAKKHVRHLTRKHIFTRSKLHECIWDLPVVSVGSPLMCRLTQVPMGMCYHWGLYVRYTATWVTQLRCCIAVELNSKAVNGSTVEHLGYNVSPVQFEDSEWVETMFFVADIDGPAILSWGICEQIGTVSVIESSNISDGPFVISVVNGGRSQRDQVMPDVDKLAGVYPEHFSGIGRRPVKFHIELKPEVPGTVAPQPKSQSQLHETLVFPDNLQPFTMLIYLLYYVCYHVHCKLSEIKNTTTATW